MNHITTLRISLFSMLALIASLIHAQEDEKDYSDAIKIVETWLEAEKDFNNYPGISAAVIDNQKVLWQGAFGLSNRDENISSTTNTIYSICSISKLFTAISIMQLRDDGKLSLESHIGDLLPWFDLPQVFDDSEPITVRSLMTHSSGLPRESNHPYWTGPDFPFPSKEAIIEELSNQETLYPASTFYQYSNLGLTLLGLIVEEVTGQTYEDYVTENIIQPLGLSNTAPYLPEDRYGQQLAKGYSALKRDLTRDDINLFQGNGITSAAGFSSTVEDLASFASWQFRLLENGGEEILKAATLKEMQRVHFLDPNWRSYRGLGFGVWRNNGDIYVGHGGSCPGYRSQLSLIPKKKQAAVVMVNSGGVNASRYVNGMIALFDKVKVVESDTLNLEQYTGFYNTQPWGSEEFLARFNNELVFIYLPNNNPAENMTRLKHVEGDTFRRIRRDDELGETVIFHRDENGTITHYTQHQNNYMRLGDL